MLRLRVSGSEAHAHWARTPPISAVRRPHPRATLWRMRAGSISNGHGKKVGGTPPTASLRGRRRSRVEAGDDALQKTRKPEHPRPETSRSGEAGGGTTKTKHLLSQRNPFLFRLFAATRLEARWEPTVLSFLSKIQYRDWKTVLATLLAFSTPLHIWNFGCSSLEGEGHVMLSFFRSSPLNAGKALPIDLSERRPARDIHQSGRPCS